MADHNLFIIAKATLKAIADSIRAKTGKTESILTSELPKEIDSIITAANVPTGTRYISKDGTYDVAAYASVQVDVENGTINLTSNGTHSVSGYTTAKVEVPDTIPEGYVKPSGVLVIDSNDKYYVSEYEFAEVNVPIPDGYIKPEGDLEITASGTYSVTDKSSVTVTIPETPEWDGSFALVFTFTIRSVTLKAEDGMTWEEWLTTDYKADDIIADGDHITVSGAPTGYALATQDSAAVTLSDKIIRGHTYKFITLPRVISFTIDGTQYNAESNMTWETWTTNDLYNTNGYKISDGHVYIEIDDGADYAYVFINGDQVKHTDLVIDGGVYNLNKPLIAFTIDGEVYQAYEAMVFGEWVADNTLNTAGFVNDGGYIKSASGVQVYNALGVGVTSAAAIDSGDEYHTSTTGS